MTLSVPSLVFAALLLSTHAALAAPPPAEAFFGEPEISKAVLSPKGNYAAYLYTDAKRRQMVQVRDTRNLEKATVAAVSASENAPIYAIHWVNEDRLTFTVRDLRVEFEGNLDEFAVNRDGSNVTHLISGNWNRRQQTVGSHMKDRVLTAAYAYYGPTHDGSDDIVVEKYLWNNTDAQPESSRLYRLNTKTRILSDLLPGAQPTRVRQWLLDAEDTPRIAYSSDKGRCILSYREKAGKDWTEIANAECFKDSFIAEFFDSRNTLYVTANFKDHKALYTFDIAKRQRSAEPLLVLDGFDFNGSPQIDYAARKLLGLDFQSDANSTVWFDAAMKTFQQKVDALVPGRSNRIRCGTDCRDPVALLVESSSDRQPTEFLVYTPAANAIVSLGGTHPAIAPADMGQRDFHRIAARDGLKIPLYVTMPPGKTKGPLPVVMLVHGGPWVRGGSWEWNGEAQFLASRGYLVLQPEFRGSVGFGAAHFKAGWQQWGRAMQDDLADTAQWAIRQGLADPQRIAIMGNSYGGYATLMGLVRNPELFRCGVDLFGVTDLDLMFTSSRGDVSEDALRYDMRTLVGDPDKDADMFRQNSPAALAARLTQPLLLAHGAEDRRVPIEHAKRLRSALSGHNKKVEWVVYADEGHGLLHENNRIDFYKRVDAFLQGACK